MPSVSWRLPQSDNQRGPIKPFGRAWRDYMRAGYDRIPRALRDESAPFDSSEMGAALCGEDPPTPPPTLSDEDLLETGLSDVVPSR